MTAQSDLAFLLELAADLARHVEHASFCPALWDDTCECGAAEAMERLGALTGRDPWRSP